MQGELFNQPLPPAEFAAFLTSSAFPSRAPTSLNQPAEG
jgi:hypothetical protein